jgi:hypothetical protein
MDFNISLVNLGVDGVESFSGEALGVFEMLL